ncbi:MAG: EscU/YscU/HrcU family type III secretion system export apparatus switch protein [Thermoanaerobaculia bacterium]
MSEQKTEKPTPKKLREARKKGQVPFSRDTSGAVLFLIGVFAAFGLGSKLVQAFLDSFHEATELTRFDRLSPQVAADAMARNFERAAHLPLTLLLVLAGAGLAVGVIQTRFNFSAYPLQPRLEKINPATRLKQWFSVQGLFEFAKTLLKLVIVLTVAYWVFSDRLALILRLIYTDSLQAFAIVVTGLVKTFLVSIGVVFLVLAVLDFLFQRWNNERQLKMSKYEVKQEYKEMEGDPHLKSHRRSLHQQLALADVRKAVGKADVVLVNPTHYAVALAYQRDKMAAPRVTAKGQDSAARRIRSFARRAGVPIVENRELARALATLSVAEEVPRELYAAVAEVLAFVYRLKERERRRRDPLSRWLAGASASAGDPSARTFR